MSLTWATVERWLNGAHAWLIRVEPDWLQHAPQLVRVALLWMVAALATGLVLETPSGVGELLAIGSHRLARRIATHSAPTFIDLLASLTVRLERLIRRYGLDLQLGERYVPHDEAPHDESRLAAGMLPAGPPRASHPTALLAAVAVAVLLTFVSSLAAAIREVVRIIARPSLANVVTWCAVLWYVGWMTPLARWIARQNIPAIPLAQVLAVLTVLWPGLRNPGDGPPGARGDQQDSIG